MSVDTAHFFSIFYFKFFVNIFRLKGTVYSQIETAAKTCKFNKPSKWIKAIVQLESHCIATEVHQ